MSRRHSAEKREVNPDPKSNTEKDPDDWTTGDEPMTEAQKSYLDTLAKEAGETLPATLTKAEASKHIDRLLDGEVLWAPAIQGAVLLSTRGGDYELHLGQDLSIGYLSHDAESIELYLQETLTFLPYTSEASVVLTH